MERCDNLTDTGFIPIGSLLSLKHLDLRDCELTDAGLVHLTPLSNLEWLRLEDCSAVTDAGLMHIAPLPRLQELVMLCDADNDMGYYEDNDMGYYANVTYDGVQQLHNARSELGLCVCIVGSD